MAWDWRVDADPATVPDEWVWERLRMRRDRRLAACDGRDRLDVDAPKWETYRKQLRDLPATVTDPRDATFPAPPDETGRDQRVGNRDALLAKVDAAITADLDYLALTAPTGAQIAAQVARLTRQTVALLRLVGARLDDTTGT